MSENTPKSKEEMNKALNDLQIDPADLDAVVGGNCDTCYSKYTQESTPGVQPPQT